MSLSDRQAEFRLQTHVHVSVSVSANAQWQIAVCLSWCDTRGTAHKYHNGASFTDGMFALPPNHEQT